MKRIIHRLLNDSPIPESEFIPVNGDSWAEIMEVVLSLQEAYGTLNDVGARKWLAGGGTKTLMPDGSTSMAVTYGVIQSGVEQYAVVRAIYDGHLRKVVTSVRLSARYKTVEEATAYVQACEDAAMKPTRIKL